jgi:hypothetical protein
MWYADIQNGENIYDNDITNLRTNFLDDEDDGDDDDITLSGWCSKKNINYL